MKSFSSKPKNKKPLTSIGLNSNILNRAKYVNKVSLEKNILGTRSRKPNILKNGSLTRIGMRGNNEHNRQTVKKNLADMGDVRL